MKKKVIYVIGLVACFWAATVFVLKARSMHEISSEALPTFFSYPEKEIEDLRKLDSKTVITVECLQKWDQLTAKLALRSHLSSDETFRLYTYLYNAERDATFLSYNAQDHFQGSLDPTAEGIIRLFISDYVRPNDFIKDPYSEKLAMLVVPKYKQRIEKENALTLEFSPPPDFMKRKETAYQGGKNVAKWIPWIALPTINYRANPPPSEGSQEWSRQIASIKQAQKFLTDEERDQINFWAGLSGPGSGDWMKIANDYMFENDIPLAKMLLVRSVLLMGLYDANIALFDAKYHFHVIRPQVRDPSVIYLISCPNHPSYPSGHSTIGMTAALILSYYFPENSKEWKRLGNEAGLSRIRAGIHYPIDHTAGQEVGKQIAEEVIKEEG